MIAFLANRLIGAMEKHLLGDMSYLRVLNAASPRGFSKFLRAASLARHCEVISTATSHVARLTATAFEDCGSCTQIAIDQARKAGVEDGTIKAVLEADLEKMSEDVAVAYRFSRAVLLGSAELDEARQAVRRRWGEGGVVDLTLATQGSRLYPMIKRGLGFAQSCQKMTIGIDLVTLASNT